MILGDTLELKKYFGDEWYKVNPFNWDEEFRAIMKEEGGFDAVIGNPPYVRQEMLGEFKEYFQQHYVVYNGVADLYAYFIERGFSPLKPKGQFGIIVANKWIRANYGESLRHWIKQQHIEEIVDFGDLSVFKGATTYPPILRLSKNPPANTFSVTQVDILNFADLRDYVCENRYIVSQTKLNEKGWTLTNESIERLLQGIRLKGTPLSKYVN